MASFQSKNEKLGIYVHIPYCLQRCTYCDFATYVHNEILPPRDYLNLLKSEVSQRLKIFKPGENQTFVDTIYFGGGTPSLIDAGLIVEFLEYLQRSGFKTKPATEITIEINPATVSKEKLQIYLAAGVNRFSVGAQTFSDQHLKAVNREHSADDTIRTLELLKSHNLNFSFDLLFALPNQTLSELNHDLDLAIQFGASHISPYCLTVPEGHPLSKNRPVDDDQIEMFKMIHDRLTDASFQRYEISNYARPGFESRHNLLYWTDENFWGVGLSAHSYKRTWRENPWGRRFWNPSNIKSYQATVNEGAKQGLEISGAGFPDQDHFEELQKNQSLTDFCHTSLRLSSGLSLPVVKEKFGNEFANQCLDIARELQKHQLVTISASDEKAGPASDVVSTSNLSTDQGEKIVLTDRGILISNQVFEKFTF